MNGKKGGGGDGEIRLKGEVSISFPCTPIWFIILPGAEMQCGGLRPEEETGERGVAMVERTRRGVEAMEVVSDGTA